MQYPLYPARTSVDPGPAVGALDGSWAGVMAHAKAAPLRQRGSRPVLLAVDDEPEARGDVSRELRQRYGDDYRVVCETSAEAGLKKLREFKMAGVQVALVLADHWMPGMTGTDFLTRVRDIHPTAKRALLVDWGDRSAPGPILQAMSLGRIDYYVHKPWGSSDERFHKVISEFLYEWAKDHLPRFEAVSVVGEHWSARSHELRDLLGRNGVPYAFHAVDSAEGQRLLAQVGHDASRLPVLVLFDGQVLVDPTNQEIADAACGVDPSREMQLSYDLVIIGSGPAGLAAAVYGASEGLEHPGRGGRGGRRPGRHELPDPQLPRLPVGRRRGGVDEPGRRAGLAVRRVLRLHAPRDRAAPGRRPAGGNAVVRVRGHRQDGDRRHRRLVPPPGHPGTRGPASAWACSTVPR